MARKMSIRKASLVYASAKYVTVITGLVISAVLSRLLTPDDYGIVAVVTVFATFFSTLANLGLGTGLIQNRSFDQKDHDSIYSFSVWISISLTVLLCFAAKPIAQFYKNDVYIPVCLLLSVSVFFNSMNTIPNSILLKEQKFFNVGIRMIVSSVVSGIVAIFLACLGFKYYALVWQSVLLATIQFIWNRFTVNLKFSFHISMKPIMSIANYSFNQFLYNMLNMLSQNLDNLLTGRFMGSEQLAYYNKSYTLMRYPVNNIPHAISPVLHPILSQYQNDKTYIYRKYIETAKAISIIGVLCFAFFHGMGEEIVLALFGKQWYDSVMPVRIFSWCIWAQLVNALAGAIYQSLGNTKEMFHSGLIHVTITILAIVIGICFQDIVILSFSVMLSFNIKYIIESVFLVRKSFGLSLTEYWKVFAPEVSMMCIIAIFDFAILDNIRGVDLFFSIIVKTVLTLVLFVVLLLVFKQSKYLDSFLPHKLRRK